MQIVDNCISYICVYRQAETNSILSDLLAPPFQKPMITQSTHKPGEWEKGVTNQEIKGSQQV